MNFNKKYQELTILHEFGHKGSLLHADEFNEIPEETLSKKHHYVNFMKNDLPILSIYSGYFHLPIQRQQLKNYFSGGDRFERFKKIDFIFDLFVQLEYHRTNQLSKLFEEM